MRGVGTLFAGLVIMTGLIVLTVYVVHVSRVATQAIHEQQQLYERARYIAEHANISGNVVNLPEPADLIVIDPGGVPHIAKDVKTLTLPWSAATETKIYVAKRGTVRVGAADPVAGVAGIAASAVKTRTTDNMDNLGLLDAAFAGIQDAEAFRGLSPYLSIVGTGRLFSFFGIEKVSYGPYEVYRGTKVVGRVNSTSMKIGGKTIFIDVEWGEGYANITIDGASKIVRLSDGPFFSETWQWLNSEGYWVDINLTLALRRWSFDGYYGRYIVVHVTSTITGIGLDVKKYRMSSSVSASLALLVLKPRSTCVLYMNGGYKVAVSAGAAGEARISSFYHYGYQPEDVNGEVYRYVVLDVADFEALVCFR